MLNNTTVTLYIVFISFLIDFLFSYSRLTQINTSENIEENIGRICTEMYFYLLTPDSPYRLVFAMAVWEYRQSSPRIRTFRTITSALVR